MPSRSPKRLLPLKMIGMFENRQLRADVRPEKEERVREWVSPRECLKRIQDWTKDPSTSEDIISQGGAVIESRKSDKKSSSAKRDKKSGAMEMALRQFVELYGWDKGGDVPIGAPREGGPDPHDVQCER
jgi:hypothetical protein